MKYAYRILIVWVWFFKMEIFKIINEYFRCVYSFNRRDCWVSTILIISDKRQYIDCLNRNNDLEKHPFSTIDQQWIIFSLLISAGEIFNISERQNYGNLTILTLEVRPRFKPRISHQNENLVVFTFLKTQKGNLTQGWLNSCWL